MKALLTIILTPAFTTLYALLAEKDSLTYGPLITQSLILGLSTTLGLCYIIPFSIQSIRKAKKAYTADIPGKTLAYSIIATASITLWLFASNQIIHTYRHQNMIDLFPQPLQFTWGNPEEKHEITTARIVPDIEGPMLPLTQESIGPKTALNLLNRQQTEQIAASLDNETKQWKPGQLITNDRQYRSIMEDFNLMSVDSPKYGAVKQSLEEYWDRRGLGRGQVAAVTNIRHGRACQLLAEIEEGEDLDQEQTNYVTEMLGEHKIGFYKSLSQQEKDQILVDEYIQAFVGGPPPLSRVYLAKQLGLDTDDPAIMTAMAAEMRRLAKANRDKRKAAAQEK